MPINTNNASNTFSAQQAVIGDLEALGAWEMEVDKYIRVYFCRISSVGE